MTITWHGLSCVSIRTKSGVSEEVTVVIDPYQNETGLRFPRTLTAEMVAISEDHSHANNRAAVGGNPLVITTPGEFEVKGVFVYGISAPRSGPKGSENRLLFSVVSEGISLAHVGALDRPLTDSELAHFEQVDILFLPVGGGEVLDTKRAGELISQIEPSIVVPFFYALPNLKMKLDPVEKFLRHMGAGKTETMPRLKVSRKDLPEEVEIKVLARD
ncbi:MBL fold metallo-hydrolase [Candidatus Uhrbacteria bacterium]|nr:MBL fold metallo-hydrolase [Candidatus Uhrbacteria bacterium]